MKTTLIFCISLVISTFTFAQQAIWGTGLAITAEISPADPAVINLSVFDPETNQYPAIGLYVGANAYFKNTDGVVVGYGGTGNMVFATYDLELHTWREGSVYLGANGVISTANGIVLGSGFGSGNNIYFQIYDLDQHSWKGDNLTIGGNKIFETKDGVVVGTGTLKTLEFATYDMEQHLWKKGTGNTPLGDNAYATTEDGVVAGLGNSGYACVGTYDVSLHSWKSEVLPVGDAGSVSTQNGVVAALGSSGSMNAAIYDINQRTWKTTTAQIGSTGSYTITNGTINYSGNQTGKKGYTNGSWGSSNTTPACKLEVFETGRNWVYLQCVTMGATSFSYNCGDGHTVTRRQGWKHYGQDNQFTITLTANSGATTSTCQTSVDIFTATSPAIADGVSLFPNPTQGNAFLRFDTPESGTVQVLTLLGTRIMEMPFAQATQVELAVPDAGLYLVLITLQGKAQSLLLNRL